MVPVWGAYAAGVADTVEALRTCSGLRPRIIVVDNASQPPIAPIAGAEILRLEARVSVGAARNAGLAVVDTPWVQFWDADDRPTPGMLDVLHALVDDRPRAAAAWLPSRGWAGGERTVPWPWPRDQVRALSRVPTLLRIASLVLNPFPATGPSILRTALVRDAGGFAEDLSYGEDWTLASLVAQRGRIVGGRTAGRLYRVDPGSLSSQASISSAAIRDCYAGLRHRIRDDGGTSLLVRSMVPLAALLHGVKVRRWGDGDRSGGGFYAAALAELTDQAPPAGSGTDADRRRGR